MLLQNTLEMKLIAKKFKVCDLPQIAGSSAEDWS